MRADVLIQEVTAKCDVLKRAGIWLPEPSMRPRAWLQNFDERDRSLAALLLDKFTFYNARLTDALLIASYSSIADGLPKGPDAPCRNQLLSALTTAVFTPVRGERPNLTDSGLMLCRRARQLIGIPESLIVETGAAIDHAYAGKTVVFLDDFIGSGDQFLATWRGKDNGRSFEVAQSKSGFVAIYLTLVSTTFGLSKIEKLASTVAVCATHVLDEQSTVEGLLKRSPQLQVALHDFLRKYSARLAPKEEYIANNASYLSLGYKERGLLLGFEHGIPDSTLPIFWAPGNDNWEPLIERR